MMYDPMSREHSQLTYETVWNGGPLLPPRETQINSTIDRHSSFRRDMGVPALVTRRIQQSSERRRADLGRRRADRPSGAATVRP